MTIDNFTSNAKGLAKNPLGIIALFLSLIYVLACLVLGTTITSLTTHERIPLLWFIVLFPLCILVVFYLLVTNHHTKLYAPSDFKHEQNFVKSTKQIKYVIQRDNKETVIKNNEDDPNEEHIVSLLQHSSVMGLTALYAVKLSIENNLGFSLESLQSNVPLLDQQYTHGYLVAASSAGAFAFVTNETIFYFTDLHPLISDYVKEIVDYYAQREADENKSEYLNQQIAMLESAFNKLQ